MERNHNSAKHLVSRVASRGISLILVLSLFLESCHEPSLVAVGSNKPKQGYTAFPQEQFPKKKKRKRRRWSSNIPTTTISPSSIPSPTKKPKVRKGSSKDEGEKVTKVGKQAELQESFQGSPSKKKNRKRKRRNRRSSVSLDSSTAISLTPAQPPTKKFATTSESPKVSHTPKKCTVKESEKKSEGKGKSKAKGKGKMTQKEEEAQLNKDPKLQFQQGEQAYYAWKYEKKDSDRNEALKWLRRAEAQGHEKARELLAKLERKFIRLQDEQERNVGQGTAKKTIASGVVRSTHQGKMQKSAVPASKSKTRTGFRDRGWFTNEALNAQLPVGYKLGVAYDDGDCFFDALAQCLNQIKNTDKYTVKGLRESCHEFYQKNKKLVADWDLADKGEDKDSKDKYERHEYDYKIQYTADECDVLFNKDICIWGRLWIEGVMICQELKLEGICVVNVSKEPATNELILSYYFLNYTPGEETPDEKALDKEEFLTVLERGVVPVLVNVEDKSHFVPLLKELESEGELGEEEEGLSGLSVESYSEFRRDWEETESSTSTSPAKAKKKPHDKSSKLQDEIKIREEQYQHAGKLFKTYRASKGSAKKVKSLLQEAIELYKEAAKKGHLKAKDALIKLRDDGLYSNPDQEAMSWYKRAVEAAGEDFDDFAASAKDISDNFEKKYQQKVANTFPELPTKSRREKKNKNKKKEAIQPTRTKRPPLRISDLIVMDLDLQRVPVRIEWGGDYTLPEEANADTIFGPLFELDNTEKYEDAVLAIDPSEAGEDETTYCVAKRYGDYYFIAAVGGLAGGYNKKYDDFKAGIGNSPAVLDSLMDIAVEHRVSRLRIEKNKDYSFAGLLESRFLQRKSSEKYAGELENKVLEFNLQHQTENKETKILDTLYPLLKDHRLIIDRQTLKNDFELVPVDDLYYKFFYQLMTVVENKPKSTTYFDGGQPKHDDRIDVVVDAIRYLQERKGRREEFGSITLEQLRSEAKKGDIEAQLELGKRYKDGLGVEENPKEALEWFKKAAKKDHQKAREALFNLGDIYQNGFGEVPGDLDKAFAFYKRAASQSYALAECALAKMYQSDFGGLEKGEAEAEIFKLYTLAANQGNASAAYELGKIYQNGFGKIKKDPRQASIRYEEAAKQGHAAAAYELAKMWQNGFGKVKADQAQAFAWYLTAAESGNREAQLEVAGRYYHGQGVNRSYSEASRWYLEAAFDGNTGAQYQLAKMYQNGWGVDKNDEQALKWYLAAAEQDLVEAQLEVGRFYQHGWVLTKPNEAKAKKWYRKAADQGNAEALYHLGFLCEKEEKYKKAYDWYNKAADKGYQAANIKLGWMNQDGLGVEKNIDIALYYYRKGAEIKFE